MGHRFSILIAACALAVSACGAAPATLPTPVAPVPVVELGTLSGETTELSRVAAGRVALVSLWATWCEACQAEMDALNRLHATTAPQGQAVVIGVAVGEDRAKVAAFAERRGLRYAQLVDPDFGFADALGQRRLPATLVIDRQGRVVFRGEALDAASLEALRRAIADGR